MPDNPPDASSAKPRRSRAGVKATDRKSARTDGRTKATLLLPDSVDFRLTAIAASLKSDRSALAAQLIDAGLRRFALDAALRQHAGSEVGVEAERAGE
jgi:predicted transcriptional regulator